MTTKKAALAGGSSNKLKPNGTPSRLGKEIRMLRRFAEGARIHRFQAEHMGDHCLPTTISDLQRRYTIYFHRERFKVPNRFGAETSVMLYWLEADSLAKARKIVRMDRGMA